jgi:hypothetical protein
VIGPSRVAGGTVFPVVTHADRQARVRATPASAMPIRPRRLAVVVVADRIK